jgi:hypothetical protein
MHSEREANKILDDIDRRWVLYYILEQYTDMSIALHCHLHLQVSDASQRVEDLSNGLEMIQRHL